MRLVRGGSSHSVRDHNKDLEKNIKGPTNPRTFRAISALLCPYGRSLEAPNRSGQDSHALLSSLGV